MITVSCPSVVSGMVLKKKITPHTQRLLYHKLVTYLHNPTGFGLGAIIRRIHNLKRSKAVRA